MNDNIAGKAVAITGASQPEDVSVDIVDVDVDVNEILFQPTSQEL